MWERVGRGVMNKYEITERIENFAPVVTAESWDCVGFMVETDKKDVSKVMLCLTVTEDIIHQARESDCDMIIAHHPLFYVPADWADIDIYSAHTNLDKANGGTTDTLVKSLGFTPSPKFVNSLNSLTNSILSHQGRGYTSEFLRFVDFENGIEVLDLARKLQKISPNLRYVNNHWQKVLKRAAFCAGSGSEFIGEAQDMGADCLVTGDLKFHTALDSEIVVFDIGHFESEILILPVLKDIIGDGVEVVFAKENSPFITI